MKKMIFALVLLSLLGSFTACAEASDTQDTVVPSPVEAEEPTPEETTPIIVAEGVTSANVQVHFETEELLASFNSYDEFMETDEVHYPRIVITTETPILDFSFVELNAITIEENKAAASPIVLHYQEQLRPEAPFVTRWLPQGEAQHRGILFTDEENQQRLFAIQLGDDNTPFLSEIEIAMFDEIETSPRSDVVGILEASDYSWVEITIFTGLSWSEELEDVAWAETRTLSQEEAEQVYEILSMMAAVEVLTPFHNESLQSDSLFALSITYANGESQDVFSIESSPNFFRLTGTYGSHGDPGFVMGMSEALLEILMTHF